MSRKPSDGERSARIGYEAQDKRAANLIYEFLVEGRLDWFKIADPNAGRVDDIQVATTDGEIHAFQVKWAETTQYISFAEVTHSTSTVPSLIAQLADGWRLLKSQNPEMNIHVHLIHRHIPHPKSALANSKIDLPLDDPPPLQPSFQGFIRDCWEEKEHWLPLGLSSIPQGWRGAIEATRKEVNPSTDKDFLEFLSACHLHFNYQFPKPEYPNNPRAIRREKDVDDIARLIAKLGGGGDRRVIEITRDKLLQNLGWGSRFEFRYKHDFPVDETLYQPITQTVVELESAITQFNSGYLALLGTPGSGKSTTLIHTLRYRQGLRLIRYYAYVPNSPLQEGRGEAQSFLHDLHLALQRQGIFSPKSVVAQPQSLEELREDFLAQLGILHEKWCEDGIRTLIVVDGLDHIEREQFPSRSLIKELFMPESIPEGVLIILGSQTLDLKDFSQRIRNHLRESGRTLTLEALTRQAVFNIIKAFALPVSLNTDQMEKINTLSNGHPLALSYLLANLRNAADENSLIDILDGTEPYQSHITDNYEIYWNKLEQDEDLKDLFALLSRLRGPFNPKKLIQWAGESTTKRFITQARHYFQEESDTRWQFFHNSFRQFILSQTRRNIFGEQDPEKDKNYHQHLAKLAAADSDLRWSWEEIFHRFCAGEWDKVLQIGTQEYFRNQFLTLRSLEAILEDTGLCLKAARIKRDGIALIRCFLIEKELGDRHQTLDISHIDLPRILYEVHGMDVALKYVIDGQQVLLGKKEAIEFVSLLIEKGQLQAAEKVFNVAEPLDLLSGSTFLESYEKENWGIVHAWAKVACYFRPLEKLFSVIEQLRTNPQSDWEGQRPQDLEHALKEDVVMTLTHCVFDSGNHDILNKFKDLLHSRENGQLFLRELDFLTCRSHKNHATSNPALERLLRWEEEGFIRELTKLQLAEFTIRIRGDRETTDKLVSGISQPSLCESKVGNWSWDDLEPFSFRIRFNRLLAMLGNPADPKQAVLDAEPSKRGGVLFERSLVLIANLWGKAWAEQTLSPFLVLQELKPVLNLFYKDSKETQDWTCWYSYRQIAPEFFGFLIHAVAEHGPEVIKELGEEFDRRWEADPKYWPTSWRRSIALALYQKDGAKEALVRRLDGIEAQMSVWDDLYTRASDLSEQTLAWVKAEQPERAKFLLPQIYKNSFGIVYEKDYQFSNWVAWLGKTTSLNLETTAEDLRRFAGALVIMEQAGRGRGRQEAAVNLVALVAQWNPTYALEMKDWLLSQQSIHYTSALAGFLRAAASSLDAPLEMVVLLTSYLLIPFGNSVPKHLPKLLAEQCALRCSANEAKYLLDLLELRLETKALPSVRADWWRGMVEGLQSAGVDATYFLKKLQEDSREKRRESDLTVLLKSGEKLSNEDALLRITTGQDLLNFINQIEEAKYFRWDKVVGKVLDTLTYEQIHILRASLKEYNVGSIVEALFLKRLKALGYVEEGQKGLPSLVAQSMPQGWSKSWDGGSRLSAMQTFIEFNPDQGRAQAFDLLVNDYLSEWRIPDPIVQGLENFLPLLFSEIPLSDLWREIRDHVYHLSDFSSVEDLPPEATTDNRSWQSNLLKFLRDILQIEVSEIREEAFRALYKICLNERYDVESNLLLSNMLDDNDSSVLQALAVLECVYKLRPQKIIVLTEEILNLCKSPNMTIRTMANRLAVALTLHVEAPSPKPLASTYLLELPDFEKFDEEAVPFASLPQGGSFPDTDDPLEMIRPFQDEFALLSRLSGIPRQNLINRAAILMKTLVPEEKWNKQAQEDMKTWLNAANLRLKYHRLRPKHALCAFNHVVAELADGDQLPGAAQEFMKHRLRRHDWVMSVAEPAQRLENIVFSPEFGKINRREGNWVDYGSETFALMPDRLKSDHIVLGELTRISHFDWAVPTEFCFSMLCHQDWPAIGELNDAYQFFPYKHTWYASDYPTLDDINLPAIAIYGHPRYFELGGQDWLALNPVIALNLGWRFCTSGLFRWKDSKGRIMVESVWWQDGPINREPCEDDICSEGWIVLASKEAFEAIRQNFKPIVQLKGVIRKITKGNGQAEIVRTASTRIPV